MDKIDSLEATVDELTAENERYRVVGDIMRHGSRTNSKDNLNELGSRTNSKEKVNDLSMEEFSSDSDSNPLKISDKERLRSSTAASFLSDIDLETSDKQEEGGLTLPISEGPVEKHVEEDTGLKVFAKTEFIFNGFGEEHPKLKVINDLSRLMEAKFIDGRVLRFYLREKCNDDEACFKYRGTATYGEKGVFKPKMVDFVEKGFGMEIDLENVDWKVVPRGSL